MIDRIHMHTSAILTTSKNSALLYRLCDLDAGLIE